MLPKTKMGDAMYRKLKVYAGADHPHAAQKPSQIEVSVTWQRLEYYGTGRRKTSTARVLPPPRQRHHHRQPPRLRAVLPHRGAADADPAGRSSLTETADKFDVLATVGGGGVAGQAGAVRLGIARALVAFNAELRKRAQDRRAS